MRKSILFIVLSLILMALTSCEREPECKWCTTVAILPDCDIIVGQGWACGETVDIIEERQCTLKDPETGVIYLLMTYCED
jgi:hypothetical protein